MGEEERLVRGETKNDNPDELRPIIPPQLGNDDPWYHRHEDEKKDTF